MKPRAIWLPLILTLLSTHTGFAGKPYMIRTHDQADLVDGKLENIAVEPDGSFRLAGRRTNIFSAENDTAIWSLLAEKGTIYAGTGNSGKIYEIRGTKSRLLFDTPEIAVLCLVRLDKSTLLAGTAPDGLIYAIPENGTPVVFARTDAHYIWDLSLDSAGAVWAATGDPAAVIRLDKSGTIHQKYELPEAHVRCLEMSGTDIWLGTAGTGNVYRIRGKDIQLVFESKYAEITALLSGDQNLWFAGISGSSLSGIDIKPGMALSPKSNGNDSGQGQIHRIDPEGFVESWWTTAAVPIFDLAMLHGRPVAACGGEGFLFQVDAPGQVTLINSGMDEPVVTIATSPEGLLLGTGKTATLWHVDAQPASQGTLESVVLDAQQPARWGHLFFEGNMPRSVTFETRSGNREEPDDYWSEWMAVTPGPHGAVIHSPTARFIQWRASVSAGKSQEHAVIRQVEVSLTKPNHAPRIEKLIVFPVTQGVIEDQPGHTGKVFRQHLEGGIRVDYNIPLHGQDKGLGKGTWFRLRGMRTIYWKTEDPNKDDLQFTLEISPENTRRWTLLAEELADPIYSFNSTAFPDGRYILRLTASDQPDNAAGSELTATKTSHPFVIDNSPPRLSGVHATRSDSKIQLQGRADDDLSRISKMEYSPDSETWYAFTSSDGLLDTMHETFQLRFEFPKNTDSVLLRITDAQENVMSTSIPVESAGPR